MKNEELYFPRSFPLKSPLFVVPFLTNTQYPISNIQLKGVFPMTIHTVFEQATTYTILNPETRAQRPHPSRPHLQKLPP